MEHNIELHPILEFVDWLQVLITNQIHRRPAAARINELFRSQATKLIDIVSTSCTLLTINRETFVGRASLGIDERRDG